MCQKTVKSVKTSLYFRTFSSSWIQKYFYHSFTNHRAKEAGKKNDNPTSNNCTHSHSNNHVIYIRYSDKIQKKIIFQRIIHAIFHDSVILCKHDYHFYKFIFNCFSKKSIHKKTILTLFSLFPHFIILIFIRFIFPFLSTFFLHRDKYKSYNKLIHWHHFHKSPYLLKLW